MRCFQIQVHTDANEAIGASPIPATDLDHSENNVIHNDDADVKYAMDGDDDEDDDPIRIDNEIYYHI